MKKIKFLVLGTFALLIGSCEKEEAYPLETVDYKSQKSLRPHYGPIFAKDTVSLKMGKLIDEDLMGKFAGNKMVVLGDKIWSVGGYQNGVSFPNQSSEVWVSSNGSNWQLATSGQFDSRVGHSLTVFDGKMWLIGGTDTSNSKLSDVWFSPNGFDWKLAPDIPAFGKIAAHSTVVFQNKLLVFTENEVWQSSDGIDWELLSEDIFPARFYTELTVFNDKLYLIGGETGTGTFYNEIWQSDNGSDWSQVQPTSPIFNGISRFSASIYEKDVGLSAVVGQRVMEEVMQVTKCGTAPI
ncbi:hypothetical protein MNBD_BACTEROID03-628 [hydrothermal vent metagenome]|uniref:DUF6242 domain-containing protein n=1 Tax=hydrothermal vent metagenome TaxID=652676 RepID=A0A3B0T9D6_9ZZZZ